jgi:crossover junction endodeoxyribonuclease RusA
MAKAAGVRGTHRGPHRDRLHAAPELAAGLVDGMRKDPNGWEDTVQCIDLDNANKVLLDALKGIVFEDDRWVRQIHAKRGEPRPDGALVVAVRPWMDETQPSLLEPA